MDILRKGEEVEALIAIGTGVAATVNPEGEPFVTLRLMLTDGKWSSVFGLAARDAQVLAEALVVESIKAIASVSLQGGGGQ